MNKLLYIVILILGVIVSVMILQDDEPLDRTEYFQEKLDSTKRVVETFKHRGDSLYTLAEESRTRAISHSIREEINTTYHEKYIQGNVIDADADSLLLTAIQISDSIIRIGYDGRDAY